MKSTSWFRIHSFTGVITGLLLFFICWSGTFAVISHELDWLVNPALRVQPQDQKASWGEMLQTVQSAYPYFEVSFLGKQEYINSPYIFSGNKPDDTYLRVFVNPYTNQVIYSDTGFDIARFFRSLHMDLFGLGGEHVGSYMVMVFGLVLLVSLVSALFLYKRWWTRFFDFKAHRKGKAFWTQMHKLAGVWSLWFLAVLAITGSYYLYEKFQWDTGILGPQKLDYVGSGDYAVHEIPQPVENISQSYLPLDSLVKKVKQEWPDLDISAIAFTWPQANPNSVHLSGEAGSIFSRALIRERGNQINLDRTTGETLIKSSTKDLPFYWVLSNAADPIHFGNFGGLTTKMIWFFFGLMLCGLILSGTYLHLKKLNQKYGPSKHGWRGTRIATLVISLIIFMTIPFGFAQARQYYGPLVDGELQLPHLPPGIKYFIISWTLVTAGIIAAWLRLIWKIRGEKGIKNKHQR